MSILCSICQDFLTERPQCLREDAELVISTLMCGHIFHHICVQTWFRVTAHRLHRETGAPRIEAGSCPCCKKEASLANALRVFPTGDEDSNAIIQQKKNLDAAVLENQKLAADLEDSNRLLKSVSSDLEQEVVAHDMLKMEYGQALSKIQALQDQLNDNKNMKIAFENSMKTEMEKLEKEKTDALLVVVEMESREKSLIDEMEKLRCGDNGRRLGLNRTRETSGVPQSKSLNITNMRIIKTEPAETSDGESPSVSPSTSQSNQNQTLIPRNNVPYPDLDD